MTISDESQQTDLFGTELDQTLLPEDFPAKTCQQQESRQALTANALDSGPSLPVCLGKLDPDTPSLKTSQTCLTETGEIGLSEYSGTFGRSGMTRNGTLYQLPTLALLTGGTGSGYWRTPAASNGNQGPKSKEFYETCLRTGQSTITLVDQVRHRTEGGGQLNPPFVEWLMGFPIGHTDLKH